MRPLLYETMDAHRGIVDYDRMAYVGVLCCFIKGLNFRMSEPCHNGHVLDGDIRMSTYLW